MSWGLCAIPSTLPDAKQRGWPLPNADLRRDNPLVTVNRYADVWDRIVAKHNLQKLSLDDLVGSSWQFTDNSLGGWGVLSAGSSSEESAPSELKVGVLLSTIKLMRAGAHATAWLPTASSLQSARVSHVALRSSARRS